MYNVTANIIGGYNHSLLLQQGKRDAICLEYLKNGKYQADTIIGLKRDDNWPPTLGGVIETTRTAIWEESGIVTGETLS